MTGPEPPPAAGARKPPYRWQQHVTQESFTRYVGRQAATRDPHQPDLPGMPPRPDIGQLETAAGTKPKRVHGAKKRPFRATIYWTDGNGRDQSERFTVLGTSIRRAANHALQTFFDKAKRDPFRRAAHARLKLDIWREKTK